MSEHDTTASKISVVMSTQTTYPATGTSVLSPPSSEGNVPWKLILVRSNQNSEQLSWFVSVYSDQAPLTRCKTTNFGFMATQPPVAVQGLPTPAPMTENGEPSRSPSALNRPLSILHTINKSSRHTQPTASIPKNSHRGQKVTLTESEVLAAPSVSPAPIPDPAASSDFAIPSPSDASISGSHSKTGVQVSPTDHASTQSDREPPKGQEPSSAFTTMEASATITNIAGTSPAIQPAQPITFEHSLVLRPISSGTYVLQSGLSLVPGDPGTVFSGTTYSLLPSATALVIDSTTIAVPQASSSSLNHPNGGPQVSLKSDEVVYEGKTLAMTSTLTLGSGSVITRLALGTNTNGQTILLGDTLTLSPSNGLSRFAIPSSQGVNVVTPSLPAATSPVSTSIESNSSSSRFQWCLSTLLITFVAIIKMLAS